MPDLVIRATLHHDVLRKLARIEAAVEATERHMAASNKRMSSDTERHSKKTQQEILKIDNAMRGTARRMASRILLIGGAIAAAAGHAVAFTAALWPMIGALGAIPAITVGGIAGIAALVVGFSGLGKAMQKTGGGSSAAASQIVSAQRRIDMANRSLRDSQESLNDAWEEASDRLRDIQTSYAGAQLDVEGAALAVRDAELALREARSSGDRQERARADLALRQARLGQIEATNRLSDVEQEFQERMSKGVEGSDEVRDASERQADALYELAEAQKALNDAMKGGGGGGGDDAYSKLSASGRKLVDTLKRLGPAWREVQQATQEAMLSGVADSVQRLSDQYLPVMLRQLPAIAQGWNNLFQSVMGVASQDAKVRDIDESLGLMGVMWQRIGSSFGRFFSGFINWTRVGADFLPRLGSWVDRLATRWDLWSARVRATGQAHQWIEDALTVGHQFNQLLGSWLSSLGKIFALGRDETLIPRLIEGSKAFEEFLDTAEGSQRIADMWARMRELGSALWRVIKQVVDILSQFDFSALATVLNVVADALGIVADNMGILNKILGPLVLALVAAKTATIALNLVKKAAIVTSRLFGIQLVKETAQVEANTAAKAGNAAAGGKFAGAMNRIERALGPLALAFVAADIAGDLFLDDLLGINQPMDGHLRQTQKVAGATRDTAAAYDEARNALADYNNGIKALTDPLFRYKDAQDQLNSAQERYNEAVAEFGADSPQATTAAWDLAGAQQGLIIATSELTNVNGPKTLQMLQQWYDQGLITKQTFDLLKTSIDAIPANTEKTIRLTYQIGYHSNLSRAAEIALANAYGSDLHLIHMRAKGGPVASGRPYVVGEEGPELFVPGQSGTIVPNGSSGGSPAGVQEVRIVVDIRGGDADMKRMVRKWFRVDGAKSFGLAPA